MFSKLNGKHHSKEEVAEDNENKASQKREQVFLDEDKVTGKISFSLIKKTFSRLGGCKFFIVLFFVFATALKLGFDQRRIPYTWAESGNPKPPQPTSDPNQQPEAQPLQSLKPGRPDPALITKYFYTTAIVAVANFVTSYYLKKQNTGLTAKVHTKMVHRFLHSSPLKQIQRTPMGTIINRFSTDIIIVDKQLPFLISQTIKFGTGILIQVIMIAFSVNNPWALLPCAIYLVYGFRSRTLFMASNREIERLSRISDSPVIGQICAVVKGGAVVRSLKRGGHF